MALPRMRTAPEVLKIIKEQDPDTAVTEHYLRGLIKSGKVPVTHVGRKKLVNADAVIEYIAAGGEPDAPEEVQRGKLRMVPV